ncbi:hypothetical protein XaplCFBP3122_10585 [Xanthomonas arboricola pv. populi]|uniref:Uncharacterized protein n=1 Tax=Xanthomonas arboricola pv. populi TaxID=487823 RepID=A0A2S6Z4J7_9XANT|nr:hypothetical protein XaplCFBP3122_10585 [Xanthomonas arboricola pv. populi]
MHYSDGHEAILGDTVAIAVAHRGVVVACLDRSEYSLEYPEAEWAYLGRGVLVQTEFGGLIHYPDTGAEHFALVARAGEP